MIQVNINMMNCYKHMHLKSLQNIKKKLPLWKGNPRIHRSKQETTSFADKVFNLHTYLVLSMLHRDICMLSYAYMKIRTMMSH